MLIVFCFSAMPRMPRFKDAEDERLIAFVGKYPLLYDQDNVDFKNIIKRENTWTVVAKKVGKDAESCKRRWRDIRDNYFRIIKKQKSGTSYFTKWSLFELLTFLEGAKRRINDDGNAPTKTAQAGKTEMIKSEFSDVENLCEISIHEMEYNMRQDAETHSQSALDVPSTSTNLRKRKTPDLSADEIYDSIARRLDVLESLVKHQSEEDDIDTFMKSITMTIRKLSPHSIAQAKMSILQVVTQLEMSNFQMTNNQSYPSYENGGQYSTSPDNITEKYEKI